MGDYITPADVGVSDNYQGHKARGSVEPGTDYATAYGTDLRMPASGTVIVIDNSNDGADGRRFGIVVDGSGETLDMIHLSSISASMGQHVTQGQRGLVRSGASGFGRDWYYGPHVHVTRRTRRGLAFRDSVDFELAVKGFGGPGGSGNGGGGSWPARAAYGADWVTSGQRKLAAMGLYGGAIDGYDGEQSQAAAKALQQAGGLTADGIYGPDTNGLADLILAGGIIVDRPAADVQRVVGAEPDGDFGGRSKLATYKWQKAQGLTADAIWGPASDARAFSAAPPPVAGFPAFPLGAGEYFGPEAGPAESVSGYHGRGEGLAVWQQQMKNRGWAIVVDGRYGPIGAATPTGETASVALAFQKEKGLVEDGLIGRQTWDAAWTVVVTPPPTNPTDPTPPPAAEPYVNQSDRSNADINAFLTTKGLTPDKAGVIAFQGQQGIDKDGIWGRTSDGLAFPPTGSVHGVDYSFARPDVAMMAARGVKLAGRYLWREKYDDGRTNKGIGKTELAALVAAGIAPFFIYEEDGHELTSFDEGRRVAKAAEAFLNGIGLAGYPIYFNVDYNATDAQMPAILDALRGVASIIGLERTGLYAGYGPMKAAYDAGVIRWGFQTYAWSGGKWDTRAQLQQWSNGQWGGTVDFTRAVAAEFGQHPVVAPTPDPDPLPLPYLVSAADAEAIRAAAALDLKAAQDLVAGVEAALPVRR